MVNLKIDIPDGFLNEEIRSEYRVSAHMKEVWAVVLDLLHEVDRVCEKHGLTYWAGYGTLLGAMRHQGFIPWDDDVDLVMPREDYERLCEIAKSEFYHPYFFQTEMTDPGFSRPFARLRNSDTTAIQKIEDFGFIHYNQGIFLDIFPLDHFPDNPEELKTFYTRFGKQYHALQRFAHWSTRYNRGNQDGIVNKIKGGIKASCAHAIQFVMERMHLHNPFLLQFEEYTKRYNGQETSRWGVPFFYNPEKNNTWERSWFRETRRVPFEMLHIPVPIDHDLILTSTYGDWREFVIGNNSHGDVTYRTDIPYDQFLKERS